MSKTTEIVRRIWDDEEGVCFEVRPDQEGLDCVEIHTPDSKSQEYYGKIRFSMDKEMAKKIGEALIAASAD